MAYASMPRRCPRWLPATGKDSPPTVIEGDAELVTLDAVRPGQGVGTALLAELVRRARRRRRPTLWVTTTNDNLDALRFYQRRGFRLARLRCRAVDEARRLKPSIPALGAYGIAIRDELDLRLDLPLRREPLD